MLHTNIARTVNLFIFFKRMFLLIFFLLLKSHIFDGNGDLDGIETYYT